MLDYPHARVMTLSKLSNYPVILRSPPKAGVSKDGHREVTHQGFPGCDANRPRKRSAIARQGEGRLYDFWIMEECR